MNTQNQVVRETRQAYQAPTMNQVQLRPEEAVLGACKTTTTATGVLEANSCSLDSCTVIAS